MKQELNLKLEAHLDLIQGLINKSINGITASEVMELRETRLKDMNQYFSLIKSKYILLFGLLSLEYKVNQENERIVFAYIDYLVHELPVDKLDTDLEVSFNFS